MRKYIQERRPAPWLDDCLIKKLMGIDHLNGSQDLLSANNGGMTPKAVCRPRLLLPS
jgi:hypothetical protein